MTKKDFNKLKLGSKIIYQGDRLPDYRGCEGIVTQVDHVMGLASIKLPDDHVCLVTRDQLA